MEMARGTIYRVVFRRRREGRTDYRLRKALISSGSLRLVIRRSIKHITLQLVEAKIEGDRVLCHATTAELKKFGWKVGTGNLPAAYLAGYLLGKRAGKKGLKSAIVDLNGYNLAGPNRIYAALKGAIDGGLEVPHDEKVLPEDDRITGEHIAKYADALQKEDQAAYQSRFSKYLEEGVQPENLPEHFKAAKAAIDKEVQ